MADPIAYSFYGTTIPILRNFASSAISILTAATKEISAAEHGAVPSEHDILDAHFGDMLPFRMQPILLAKFALEPLQNLHLEGSSTIPTLDPGFTSLDAVVDFFKQLETVFDAVDESQYNESAGKSVDVSVGGKTLHMTSLADYFHSFVIPNGYFHLNAMYMLLRSRGFKLGKGLYIGPWMSEQQKKDWAPLRN
ncbi:hypothetical protein ACN47E_007150 [Coniothyrium glycines]